MLALIHSPGVCQKWCQMVQTTARLLKHDNNTIVIADYATRNMGLYVADVVVQRTEER